MRRAMLLFGLVIPLLLPLRPSIAEVPSLRPAAELGPWPVASQLIGFQDRIWFVNSIKGVNHNSADLYSFAPDDLRPQFERSLFSQDAGDPVVVDGRLYWPLEDSRNSVGWAEVTFTDGRLWRRVAIPTAQSFHNHAMVAWQGRLIAATSAWRAGLQVSDDKGLSWQQLYDHPTPDRRVSRVVKLAAAKSFVLGHLIDVGRHRLLRSDGESTGVLPGWSEDLRVTAMAARDDAVYLVANLPDGIGIWRSDGGAPRKLAADLPRGRVQDLQASEGRLWLLISAADGGSVWSSVEGLNWREELRILGGVPWDLHVQDAALYVGGTAESGLAAIWALAEGTAAQRRKVSTRRRVEAAPSRQLDWSAEAARLDRLLAEPESYRKRSTLRDEVHRLAEAVPAPGFFAARLQHRSNPTGDLPLIGGQVRIPNHDFADWLLLWGMGLSGQKGVPPSFLLRPWRSPPNGAEKYFEPVAAALWAVVLGGQADRATIVALIERMGFEDDPAWLRNQVAGSLATLTGQPKQLKQDAWLEWWAVAGSAWPD